MIYERWSDIKYKYRNRELWCKGYYVDTAGKNARKIAEYIQNQLKEDALSDQLALDLSAPFTGGGNKMRLPDHLYAVQASPVTLELCPQCEEQPVERTSYSVIRFSAAGRK